MITVIFYSLRSFGCVLYELFTLNKLFEIGTGMYETFKNIIDGPIPIIEESEPIFQPIFEKYLYLFIF